MKASKSKESSKKLERMKLRSRLIRSAKKLARKHPDLLEALKNV